MTTGRIHAGSISASCSENYNYTQRSNSDHCQPFSGTTQMSLSTLPAGVYVVRCGGSATKLTKR